MVSLNAYYDESIQETKEGHVHVVASYVAQRDLWIDLFAPSWKRVLREASRRSLPLREFKARDCVQGEGSFRGWPRSDREDLLDALISVILEVGRSGELVGTATALVFPGMLDTTQMDRRQANATRSELALSAYGHCIGWCFYDTLRLGPDIDAVRAVTPIYDRRDGFHRRAVETWSAVLRVLTEHSSKQAAAKVKRPNPGESHKCLPIQAADLLAYETKEETLGRLNDWPVRLAIKRLVTLDYLRARALTVPLISNGLIRRMGEPPMLFETGANVRAPRMWFGKYLRDTRE